MQILKEKVTSNQKELENEQKKLEALENSIQLMQSSLKEFANSLKELSAEQRSQASSLRDMQMQMLNKVEEFEKEKRKQSSELIKIKVLMQGNLNEEQTIKLTISSLNLSITALKRAKEIIIEIAFFFKSFIDFINEVANQAKEIINSLERRFKSSRQSSIGPEALKAIIDNTDNFFITQIAEWYAVGVVSEKFVDCFNFGWSKLNKLSGKYLFGDELSAYLKSAGDLIQEIVNEREVASQIRSLQIGASKSAILGLSKN